MNPLSRFLFVGVFCCSSVTASADQVTYLDANGKPASASSYTYKRVMRYEGPVLNPNIGIGYYGGITAQPMPTGLHRCSRTDYYKSGQPAVVLAGNALGADCSQWSPNGPFVSYYPDGHIKEKAYFKLGKLEGEGITYNEDGSVKSRDQYDHGVPLDTKTFAVSPKHPLLGTWKYVHYGTAIFGLDPTPDFVATVEYSSDGTLVVVAMRHAGGIAITASATREVKNWKYIVKTPKTGTLEEYRGTELLGRDEITWLNPNQIEHVCTFSTDPNKIGARSTWTRQ